MRGYLLLVVDRVHLAPHPRGNLRHLQSRRRLAQKMLIPTLLSYHVPITIL